MADNPTGGRLPADPLIAPTIRAIFCDFFRSNEQVIVFIGDSSDGRQLARMRKFTDWFYGKDHVRIALFKFDVKISDPKAQGIIYVSAILSSAHPRMSQFVEVFQNVGQIAK